MNKYFFTRILPLLLVFFASTTPLVLAAKVCPVGQFAALCELNGDNNTTLFQNVFSILLVAAVGLSMGFLLYGGIKWITSGGDKAKLDAARGTITAAVVGLIISFLAFFIVGLVNYLFGVNSTNGTAFTLPTLRGVMPN